MNGLRVNILGESVVGGSNLSGSAGALRALIAELECDRSWARGGRLKDRIRLLDELDAGCGSGEPYDGGSELEGLYERARTLQGRIESLNRAAFQAIRRKIRQGIPLEEWRRWIGLFGFEAVAPAPGLGYDELDELVSGVFEFQEPGDAGVREPEVVFFQPTPARHILDLIEVSALAEGDVLIDLGCGLGHVAMQASILTACRAIGVELESAYIQSARECAERLDLHRVAFVQQDARDADLSGGNVFYLYTPFTGDTWKAVVAGLRKEAEKRPIRICTLGPCTLSMAKESWLSATGVPHEGRVTCFMPKCGSEL